MGYSYTSTYPKGLNGLLYGEPLPLHSVCCLNPVWGSIWFLYTVGRDSMAGVKQLQRLMECSDKPYVMTTPEHKLTHKISFQNLNNSQGAHFQLPATHTVHVDALYKQNKLEIRPTAQLYHHG